MANVELQIVSVGIVVWEAARRHRIDTTRR
jgi:hypothetical protein